MAEFQPAPTYELPIEFNKRNPEKSTFSPNWLNWFLQLTAALDDITGSGVFDPQVANTIFAGPTTGADAAPTFRAIVTADYPAASITYAKIQNVTDSRLLGRSAGSAGAPMEITVGAGLSLAAGSLTATGDVAGPASSTDNAVVRFNGATGKSIQNSGAILDDSNNLSTASLLGTGGSTPSSATSAAVSWASSGGIQAVINSGGGAAAKIADTIKTTTGVQDRLVVDNYSSSVTVRETVGTGSAITSTRENAPLFLFPSATNTVFGHTAAFTAFAGISPRVQVSGTTSGTGATSLFMWQAGTTTSHLTGNKSRNATPGSHTVVQSGDTLLQITGCGSDGTNFEQAAIILFAVDGTPGNDDMPGRIEFYTVTDGTVTATLAGRIDSSQRMVLGTVASQTVGNAGRFQVNGLTDANSQIQVSRYSADASGPTIAGSKSRNATEGGNTIAQSGDTLLNIIGYGADGTNYDTAAAIRFQVDGTPGAGTDMPGRIVALTSPDGTATLTEAWRVDNAQKHIFQVDRAVRFNNQTSAAAANVGTLNNAPAAGDPGYWLKINIDGTNYALPAWAG